MNFFSRDALLPNLLGAFLPACLLLPLCVDASPVGDALRQLTNQTYINREVHLKDLGFSRESILTGDGSQGEFYFPVAEGIDLTSATVNFRGNYVLNDSAQAGVVLSVDGVSQAVELATEKTGEISKSLVVPKGVRKGRFIKLNVDWESIGTQTQGSHTQASAGVQCANQPVTGNRLAISNDTILRYRYDSQSITNVTQAWQMLPREPVLLVAGNPISQSGFDTAWRVGTILGQLGHPAKILAFPGMGDVVDLKAVSIPPALAAIPAYASLASIDQITISDPAQAGALLTLGTPATAADIAVVDARLQEQIARSLDALQAQLELDADALQAFKTWRNQRMSLTTRAAASSGLVLNTYAGQPVLTVGDSDGSRQVGAFIQTLLPILTPDEQRAIKGPGTTAAATNTLDILSFGPGFATFPVLEKGNWIANIPLSELSSDGRRANRVTVDVTTVTDPSGVRPVMTIFWNDVLLDAKQLKADGRPESLTTRVPPYVTGINNALRISVQRASQALSGDTSTDCPSKTTGYPVTVLPSSHIVKGAADSDGSFSGTLPLLAGTPQLFTPSAYLEKPASSLQTLISLATSTGLAVRNTTLVMVPDNREVKPERPFVAMETPVDAVVQAVRANEDGQIRVNNRVVPSVTAADRLSAAQIVRSHQQDGLIWYPLVSPLTQLARPFDLTAGTSVILDQTGVRIWLDGDRPSKQSRSPQNSAFYEWRHQMSWGVPLIVGLILAFVILLVLAARARRKHEQLK